MIIYILVCADIKMVTKYDADHLHWTLGTCSPSFEYTNGKVFKEKDCCLAAGNHTLTCYNTRQPHGWKKGFIVINGERYCDDFIGYKAMRRIIIKGNILKSSILYKVGYNALKYLGLT